MSGYMVSYILLLMQHNPLTHIRRNKQHKKSQVNDTLAILHGLLLIILRSKIEARVSKEKGMILIFLESLCDDPATIAANVALKVSSGDPDYKDMSREDAHRDFIRRIKEYEKVYETITEPHLSYLRIVNVGNEVTVSRIKGYLSSRIAFFLMNLHLKPRSVFFSRVST